jgi:hypothetical protein
VTYEHSSGDLDQFISFLLNHSSLDQPIEIETESPQNKEVYVIGVVYDPADGPISGGPNAADGICDSVTSTGLISKRGTVLLGHAPLSTAASGSIRLNLNSIHLNPIGTYNGIANGVSLNSIPSKNDWMVVDDQFAYNTLNFARLSAVSIPIGPEELKIRVDPTGTDFQRYTLPMLFPMTLEFDYSGSSIASGCGNVGTCAGRYRVTLNGLTGFVNASEVPGASIGTPPLSLGGNFKVVNAANSITGDTFSDITRQDIVDWELKGNLSGSFQIQKSSLSLNQILLLKTTDGNYVKIKVTSFTGTPGVETMNGDFVVFNNTGVPNAVSAFSISNTWLYDFDGTGMGCGSGSSCDAWWRNIPPQRLEVKNSAKMGVYP